MLLLSLDMMLVRHIAPNTCKAGQICKDVEQVDLQIAASCAVETSKLANTFKAIKGAYSFWMPDEGLGYLNIGMG